MSTALFLRSCGLALCVSWAGDAGVERVVERRFDAALSLHSESFELTVSEEGRTVERQAPDFVRAQTEELEIEDALADDHEPPTKFTRLYRLVASTLRIEGKGAPEERRANAGLEGKRVTFERNERGGFDRSCGDEDVRQRQIDKLRADLSLGRFLPSADLAVGESWTLSFADFEVLLSPVGEFGTRPARRKPAATPGKLDLSPSVLTEPMWTLLAGAEGEAQARLVEPAREGEEYPCSATIEFRFESAYDGEKTFASVTEAEVEDEATLEWKGTGKLAWDPGDGRIHVELQGELTLHESFSVRVEAEGKSGELRGKLAGAGTLRLEASERRPE